MLEKLANVFRIPELRSAFCLRWACWPCYRLGGHIPTPGVNADKLQQFFEQNRGSFPWLHRHDVGQPVAPSDHLRLGIMPYITASIILQLLTVFYEPLRACKKEGEWGGRDHPVERAT